MQALVRVQAHMLLATIVVEIRAEHTIDTTLTHH
jgi:hypothetical protein